MRVDKQNRKKYLTQLLSHAATAAEQHPRGHRQNEILITALELFLNNKLGDIHDAFGTYLADHFQDAQTTLRLEIEKAGGEDAFYEARIVRRFTRDRQITIKRALPNLRSLLMMTPKQMEAIPKFGPLRITEVVMTLQLYGLALSMPAEAIDQALGMTAVTR